MEHFVKWLDEFDDLLRVLLVQARPVLVTLFLLSAFIAVAGGIIAFGAPSLLAAP